MLCVRSPLPSPAGSEISVGAPSPPPRREYHRSGDDYFQPLKKLKLVENRKRSVSPPSPKSNIERVKSFSIADILGHKDDTANNKKPEPEEIHENFMPHRPTAIAEAPKFVHPWDPFRGGLPVQPFISPALFHYDPRIAFDYQRQLEEHFHMQAQILRHMNMTEIIPSESGSERSTSAASNCCSPEIANRLSADSHQSGHSLDDIHSPNGRSSSSKDPRNCNENNSSGGQKQTNPNGTPLDALFQMTNKNFDESQDESNANLFSNRPQTKKKRKSRTAFTNHQIFGLEKRFLYQKYLSPVDRDEIAASLGLSGAQVITWFQNRRAKLKRDIEELKKDVESAKVLGTAPKGFMDNINELSRLNKNPLETAMSA